MGPARRNADANAHRLRSGGLQPGRPDQPASTSNSGDKRSARSNVSVVSASMRFPAAAHMADVAPFLPGV